MPYFSIQAPPVSPAKAPPVSAGTKGAVGGAGQLPTELVKPTDTSKVQVYQRWMCTGGIIASQDMPKIHTVSFLVDHNWHFASFWNTGHVSAEILKLSFLSPLGNE